MWWSPPWMFAIMLFTVLRSDERHEIRLRPDGKSVCPISSVRDDESTALLDFSAGVVAGLCEWYGA
ncbi:hypothetical protein JG687_00019169 [Phytophthora cactorum]|uniref:Uncharacterized protein n=1 Tax=Phytophthora cactorum TaxID=29920 RepID=A0A8T1TL38_9STRA|nr:hypothetical protein JG687_00019169 [Phytophthora cactorum]